MASDIEKVMIAVSVMGAEAAQGALNKIQSSVLSIGAAYLSWEGAKAIIGWSIGAAMESEEVWAGVANAVKNIKESVDVSLPALHGLANSMRDKFGVSDEVIGKAEARMMHFGLSSSDSMRAVAIAADFATARNIELSAAADLLGKAYAGNTAMLGRYGIVIADDLDKSEKFTAALEGMERMGMGALEARTRTLSGALDRLGEAFSEVGENAGSKATPVLAGMVNSMADWLIAFREANGVLETTSVLMGNALVIATINARTQLEQLAAQSNTTSKAMLSTVFSPEMVSAADPVIQKAKELLADARMQTEEADKLAQALYRLSGAAKSMPAPILEDAEKEDDEDRAAQAREMMEDYYREKQRKELETNLFILQKQKEIQPIIQGYIRQQNDDAVKYLAASLGKQKSLYRTSWQQIANIVKPIGNLMGASLEYSLSTAGSSAANQIVNAMMGGKARLKDIWKDMAGDFVRYFVQSAIQALAGKLLTFLASLFDNPVNDAMAGRQGYDFGKYFGYGFQQAMANFAVIPSMANTTTNNNSSSLFVISGGASSNADSVIAEINRRIGTKQLPIVTEQNLKSALDRVTFRRQ